MNFKIIFYFFGSFLPSWIRIRIPNTDPDPLTRLNPDPIRTRNPGLIMYLLQNSHGCLIVSFFIFIEHGPHPVRLWTFFSLGKRKWCPGNTFLLQTQILMNYRYRYGTYQYQVRYGNHEGLSGSGFIFQIICTCCTVERGTVPTLMASVNHLLWYLQIAVSSINIRLHDRRFIFSFFTRICTLDASGFGQLRKVGTFLLSITMIINFSRSWAAAGSRGTRKRRRRRRKWKRRTRR